LTYKNYKQKEGDSEVMWTEAMYRNRDLLDGIFKSTL